MDRAEYITCITGGDKESLCGRNLSMEFAFLTVEHAKLNDDAEGRLTVCPECAAKTSTVFQHVGDN